MRISGIFFSLLFFLGACSPAPTPESASTPSTEELNKEQMERFEKALKPRFIHLSEAEDHLGLFDFTCEDCPLSFGQFLATKVDGSKPKPANLDVNCQGGLVAEDVFLTNRHCIPEELREENASCENKIKILFPTVNDMKAEIVGCKEILDFYVKPKNLNKKDPQPDWALIRLEKNMKDRMTPLEHKPIPDQTEVVAFVPLVGQNPDFVELKKITCISHQNTLSLPEYSDDVSPIAFFKCDQDITRGFSGTLLFENIENELKPIATLSHIWDVQRNKEDILVSKFIVASPVQCIRSENPLDEKCAFNPEGKNNLKEKLVMEKLEPIKKLIAEQMTQYLSSEHPILWDKINMEEVKAGQTAQGIINKWRHLIGQEHPKFLSEDSRSLYFETLVQIQPRCLKKDFVPTGHKTVKTNIPVNTLRIHRDSQNRVEILHEVRHVPVEILLDAADLSKYTFKSLEERPKFTASKSSILSYRFNHLATSVPSCP